MSLDQRTCPHCGYKSDDDALCAACGKFFDEEDYVADTNRSVLKTLAYSLEILLSKDKVLGILHDDPVFREEPEFDPTWSFLSSNIYHKKNK